MNATLEATAETSTTTTSAVVAGTRRLAWAFHPDFTAYVERLADGRVDTTGGVERTADGRFLFPMIESRCTGAVHWTGHHGMLAVTLADPAVEQAEGGSVITIADPFAGPSPRGERMVLADLGAGDATETGRRYPRPVLTEAGADLFFGHYQEGLVLAPLEIEDPR